jgi:hypothetical protein
LSVRTDKLSAATTLLSGKHFRDLDDALYRSYNATMLISTRRPRKDFDRHAMHLRDVAIQIVTAHQTLSYADDFICIEYRPRVGDRPSGLDIWLQHDLDRKVLAMIWSDIDTVVISYRSGAWERALARAAAGIAA